MNVTPGETGHFSPTHNSEKGRGTASPHCFPPNRWLQLSEENRNRLNESFVIVCCENGEHFWLRRLVTGPDSPTTPSPNKEARRHRQKPSVRQMTARLPKCQSPAEDGNYSVAKNGCKPCLKVKLHTLFCKTTKQGGEEPSRAVRFSCFPPFLNRFSVSYLSE